MPGRNALCGTYFVVVAAQRMDGDAPATPEQDLGHAERKLHPSLEAPHLHQTTDARFERLVRTRRGHDFELPLQEGQAWHRRFAARFLQPLLVAPRHPVQHHDLVFDGGASWCFSCRASMAGA